MQNRKISSILEVLNYILKYTHFDIAFGQNVWAFFIKGSCIVNITIQNIRIKWATENF